MANCKTYLWKNNLVRIEFFAENLDEPQYFAEFCLNTFNNHIFFFETDDLQFMEFCKIVKTK